MGTHHGNEPAGREMALKLLRNLAFTDDPKLLNQLKETTVLFIPTINPDGRAINKRFSAEDVDLNRDHLNLRTPEIRAVAKVINKFHPDITIDAHERTGSKLDIMMLWPQNLNIDGELLNLNQKMVKDYVWPDVKKAGYTTGLYSTPDSKVSGGERVMTNMGGIRHGLVLLTESSRQRKPKNRVKMQLRTAESVLRFQRERFDDIADVVNGAPERKAAVGANQSMPFYLNAGTNRDLEDSTILQPPPCGYLLNTS